MRLRKEPLPPPSYLVNPPALKKSPRGKVNRPMDYRFARCPPWTSGESGRQHPQAQEAVAPPVLLLGLPSSQTRNPLALRKRSPRSEDNQVLPVLEGSRRSHYEMVDFRFKRQRRGPVSNPSPGDFSDICHPEKESTGGVSRHRRSQIPEQLSETQEVQTGLSSPRPQIGDPQLLILQDRSQIGLLTRQSSPTFPEVPRLPMERLVLSLSCPPVRIGFQPLFVLQDAPPRHPTAEAGGHQDIRLCRRHSDNRQLPHGVLAPNAQDEETALQPGLDREGGQELHRSFLGDPFSGVYHQLPNDDAEAPSRESPHHRSRAQKVRQETRALPASRSCECPGPGYVDLSGGTSSEGVLPTPDERTLSPISPV